MLKKLQLIHSKVVKYIPKKAKHKPWALTQKEIEQCSFYPETKKKPLTIIHQEFRYLCSKGRGSWTHENTISHYFQFGLDRLGTDIHNYIFQEKYDKARDAEHPVFSSMLEHKGYTATVLKDAGINISCPLGTLDAEGNIHKGNRIVNTLQQLINSSPHNAYFCKPIDGFQSRDCYKINCENTTYKLNNESYTYTEVLQKLTNHSIEPYIVSIQPKAL